MTPLARLKNACTSGRFTAGFVFTAWSVALIMILGTNRIRLFLRPEFSWLLGMGAVIALAFMLASIRRPAPVPFLRATILLLPLLHMAVTDSILGGDVFANRFLGVDVGTEEGFSGQSFPDSSTHTPDAVSDRAISEAFANAGLEPLPNPDEPLTALDLLRSPGEYAGKEVTLLGLLYRNPDLERYFGAGRTVALYRFLITCCAADAMPLTVALDMKETPDLPPEQWVRVEGTFELLPHEDKTVPLIRVTRMTNVAPPASPYLY